ncbi:MAG: glucose-6-phosphate isomerase [Luminiphilus sp.]
MIAPPALHQRLYTAAERLDAQPIAALFSDDAQRAEHYRCQSGGIVLDFAKHRLDDTALQALLDLADARHLAQAFSNLIAGDEVNASERRAALHTLLRGTGADALPTLSQLVDNTLSRMAELVAAIHSGTATGFDGQSFTDVVNLGIGGSDLGPRLICEALHHADAPLRAHFVANIDPHDLDTTLEGLEPARTLFVICSKSFSTEETLSNTVRARAWLKAAGATTETLGRHLIAVTTQVERAGEWSVWPERCLPLWDWVGGRYSLWSAVGISVPLALGWDAFARLLGGARSMDEHTATSPPGDNLPMMMALLELWQTQYLSADTHAVLPYAQRLARLPDFLQQLTMESNGKRVSSDGRPLSHHTAPVLWGSAGTIGQHSYYQLLHQGTRAFTADIILPLTADHGDRDARRALAAHALAQSRALMVGRSTDAACKLGADRGFSEQTSRQFELPGNHSHSLITLERVSPECLGGLIAAYEHKTYFLGVLLGINSFDQWGVELGKEIAADMQALLRGDAVSVDADPSTMAAIKAWQNANPET